jgi:hypothetical protein
MGLPPAFPPPPPVSFPPRALLCASLCAAGSPESGNPAQATWICRLSARFGGLVRWCCGGRFSPLCDNLQRSKPPGLGTSIKLSQIFGGVAMGCGHRVSPFVSFCPSAGGKVLSKFPKSVTMIYVVVSLSFVCRAIVHFISLVK